MLPLVVALSLAASSPADNPRYSWTGNPELILSNVRMLVCDKGRGTGWIIGKNILVTASHVAEAGNCKDSVTGAALKAYKKDPTQDLTLMTGALPDYKEYIKYSCAGYKPGWEYEVYGWSSYGYPESILRKQRVVATNIFSKPGDKYRDGTPFPVLRRFNGYVVPGMSGGLYSKEGVVYGIVTAGIGIRTILGYMVAPEVYSTDLKDTILCSH